MATKSISRQVIKDIAIVGIGVLVIWIGLQVAFGTQNPFYVVASGSMVPALEVYDVLIVQGHEPFEEIEVGDIIVFNRPSDHNRVIVHRVESVLDDDPRTLRTKGDANPSSIPGTDFPITTEEYIGKVAYTVPQIGYVTQLLKPPINYVIIAVVIGIMVVKQVVKRKKERDQQDPFLSTTESETLDESSKEAAEEISDLDETARRDSEYSEFRENSEFSKDTEGSVELKEHKESKEAEKDTREENKG